MSQRIEPDLTNVTAQADATEYQSNTLIAAANRAMAFVNRMVTALCMLALLLAACILTYSVVARYFLKISTDWQDEAAIFLLVGAVFLGSAYVQSMRGHIGIDALANILPPRANRLRALAVDLASLVFCLFFAWKSWTLLAEAVHDGYTTGSSWGPPLWIPYSAMAVGMSLLCVQILLQFADRLLSHRIVR
jgi:TRAP-type C4-dicarboxylate transport system permease small subunit